MVNLKNTLVGLVLAGASLFSGCATDNYKQMEQDVRNSAYLTAESFANSDLPKRKETAKVTNSEGFIVERIYYLEGDIKLSTGLSLVRGDKEIAGGKGKYIAIDKNSIELGIHDGFNSFHYEPHLSGEKITLSSNNIKIISYPMVIEYKKIGEEWKKSTSKIIDATHDESYFFKNMVRYELKTISNGVLIEPDEIKKYLELMERIRQKVK